MTTDVAVPMKNYFETYGESVAPANMITGQLLVFTKFGEYKAGQDKLDVPAGTKLVAGIPSLRVGWVKWVGNKPADMRMGLIVEGFAPPLRGDLGDIDEDSWERFDDGRPRDPWQFTNYLQMLDEEDGSIYTFATASKGGLSAVGELCKAYGERIRTSPDDVPIVELGMRSYLHPNKSFGEIRTPQFDVVGWVEMPPQLLAAANGKGAEKAEKPKAIAAPVVRSVSQVRPAGRPVPAKVAPPPPQRGKTAPGKKSIRF